MKYFFTLVFALLAGVTTTTAQTVTITKTDGTTINIRLARLRTYNLPTKRNR